MACLPPIWVIIPQKCRMTALRLVCTAPSQNLSAARLSPDFLSLLRYRAPDAHRYLSTCLPPNVMPLPWRTQRPLSKVRSHLPVDQLANITLSLLGPLSRALLASAHLLPDTSQLPPADTMKAVYHALQAKTRPLLTKEWKAGAPTPTYYTYPLSLTPHPFMGLGKFVAGRIQ